MQEAVICNGFILILSNSLVCQISPEIFPCVCFSLCREKWMKGGWRLWNETVQTVTQRMEQQHTGAWLVYHLCSSTTHSHSSCLTWLIYMSLLTCRPEHCSLSTAPHSLDNQISLFHSSAEQNLIWLGADRVVWMEMAWVCQWLWRETFKQKTFVTKMEQPFLSHTIRSSTELM